MPKITEMYCFAVYDKDEDDEGIPAIAGPYGAMPLVGSDMTRIESLMERVQDVADTMDKPLRIYKFTHREQIGEIIPRGKR